MNAIEWTAQQVLAPRAPWAPGRERTVWPRMAEVVQFVLDHPEGVVVQHLMGKVGMADSQIRRYIDFARRHGLLRVEKRSINKRSTLVVLPSLPEHRGRTVAIVAGQRVIERKIAAR